MWCGPQLSPNERALVRSQSGPLSSVPSRQSVSKLDSEPFRVLLLRRLRLPLPFIVCACQCGSPLDTFGHHHRRASFQEGFATECAIAQIFLEGGARVSTNVMVRDLGIASPHRSDLRRLEVVAEGLTLFLGCQLAIDATVASPLHSDVTQGMPWLVKFWVRLAN